MSAPLPDALWARFQKLVEEGLSCRAAALRLKLSPAMRARWGLAIRLTGQARAAPQGRPRGKAHIRRIGARTFTDTFHALKEISDLFSPEECWNYFKAAGYFSG